MVTKGNDEGGAVDGRQASANLNVAARDLKYYIFDWDDNILHMPTRIHLERRTESGEWVPHAVSTSVYSVIRTLSKPSWHLRSHARLGLPQVSM